MPADITPDAGSPAGATLVQSGHPVHPLRRARLLALLAAAWVVPTALHLTHADLVLPVLVLVGTAALVRGGRSLLDRLIVTIGLLVGATCAVGLLWSVWPWGLHPVPIAGLAFSVLVLIAAKTGRRPRLPRPSWVDALSIGAAGLVVTYLSMPYVRAPDFTRRLGIVMSGEDNARHEAAFDVIGRVGGYLFVRQDEARELIFSGMIFYPQGWHLVVALLDGFVRSPGSAPGGPIAFDHYIVWTLAGHGLLVLVLVWAMQRVTGQLHALQRLVAVAAVVALTLGTELTRLLIRGYPSEALGLSLAVIVAVLVVRPLPDVREQLVVFGALLIGIGFVYYLFLFPAGLLVAYWLVRDWRHTEGQRREVALVALLTVLLAPITAVCGLLLGGQSEALGVVGQTGPAYNTLLLLGVLVGAGLLSRSAWREPVWRRYLVALGVTVAFAVAIAGANVAAGVRPGYYFIKAGHLCMAVMIIGVAALARFLPVPADGSRLRCWIGPTGIATSVTVAVFTATGVVGWSTGVFHVTVDGKNTTWARGWTDEVFQFQRQAAVTMAAYQAFPPVDGTVTLVMDEPPIDGYRESVYLSSVQGTSAQTERGIYIAKFTEPARLKRILGQVPGPVRLIVTGPAPEAQARAVLDDDPKLRSRVTIVKPPS